MKRTLLLLAGSPATGKSYLIDKIRQVVPNLVLISPDSIKESLADKYGFDNLIEKEKLEIKVWQSYYHLLDDYMQIGQKVIVTEYPFSNKQAFDLKFIATTYQYQIMTICLNAEFEILWKRRYQRDRELGRHLSHLVSSYHYGDELIDRDLADNQITKKEFQDIIKKRAYSNFELGYTIKQDVSDFTKVDYDALMQKIQTLVD